MQLVKERKKEKKTTFPFTPETLVPCEVFEITSNPLRNYSKKCDQNKFCAARRKSITFVLKPSHLREIQLKLRDTGDKEVNQMSAENLK